MNRCVGVVLAGGAGRRLGRTKGDLVVGRLPMAERAATALWPFCAGVLISVAPGAENPAPRFPAVEDTVGGRGPLAGIDAVFRASGAADLLVLACDYPRVGTPLLRRLLAVAGEGGESEDCDVVMPTDAAGRDHPLVAIWRRSAEAVVREALEAGRLAVRGVLPDLRVRRLGPPMFAGLDLPGMLLNVNWPDDLRELD